MEHPIRAAARAAMEAHYRSQPLSEVGERILRILDEIRFVWIADLRKRVPDLSREVLNEALLELENRSFVWLGFYSDPSKISPQRREAGFLGPRGMLMVDVVRQDREYPYPSRRDR